MSTVAPDSSLHEVPSQVSWQVLFWCLVPLIISTMSQPAGHICGTSRRHRTYLRSSPFICLADIISILARLLFHLVASFQNKRRGGVAKTFKYRLDSFLKFRFEDNEVDHGDFESDRLKTIERMTWLRWLFFAFGTLGPGNNLFAMKGVMWTKLWGATFFVSFLIVEILVVLSWRRKRLEDDLKPSFDWYNAPDSPLLKLESVLFKAACVMHCLVVFWLISSLWPRIPSKEMILQRTLANPKFGPPTAVLGRLAILLIESTLLSFLVLLANAFQRAKERFAGLQTVDLEEAATFVFSAIFFMAFLVGYIIGIFFWLGAMCCLVDAVTVVCLLSPIVFALQPTGGEVEKERVLVIRDKPAFLYYGVFCYTVVLTFAWYAINYDPTGTDNPGWTAVFG